MENAYPAITLEKQVLMTDHTIDIAYIELAVKAMLVKGPKEKVTGLSRATMDRTTVHLIFLLEGGWQQRYIAAKDVERALEEAGLKCHRANRDEVKVDGTRTGVFTETIHANVSLMRGDWDQFKWPDRFMVIAKNYGYGSLGERVPYKIDKSPHTDHLVCPKKTCHAPLEAALRAWGISPNQ